MSNSDCGVSSDCAVAQNTSKGIYFDSGTAELNMNDRMLLDTVADHMGNSGRIELSGYTCKKMGPDQINLIFLRSGSSL
ncbi:hypothetical protein [Endozoicomonas sp. ONNA2]|uniref:hypothetical protein n=1 Tax=Endozoicomonas sp. ONNA2 TaxID=2828741 RepID=UPI0021491CA5|nr:hypothetical protein [Endozoicomonas sp. ONNA2]